MCRWKGLSIRRVKKNQLVDDTFQNDLRKLRRKEQVNTLQTLPECVTKRHSRGDRMIMFTQKCVALRAIFPITSLNILWIKIVDQIEKTFFSPTEWVALLMKKIQRTPEKNDWRSNQHVKVTRKAIRVKSCERISMNLNKALNFGFSILQPKLNQTKPNKRT